MRFLRLKIFYEGTMIVLVVISLAAMLTNEESNFRYVHQIIWFIFLIDVLFRFIRTSVKWRYIKNNPFDIVTVIPLEDMMVLARFARFLRLFRYKNLVKRYVDGISKRFEQIGFLRLSIGLFIINIVIAIILAWVRDFGILKSNIWVWSNFFKFNYGSDIEGLVLLSIIIKIVGLIYLGIVISEAISFGRKQYEKYREKRNREKVNTEETKENIK